MATPLPTMLDNEHDWDEDEFETDDHEDSPVVIDPESWRVFSPEEEGDDEEEFALETRESLPPAPELEGVLVALAARERNYDDLRVFSDLGTDDLARLSTAWPAIEPELRASVIRESSDIALDDLDLQMNRLFRFATTDQDAAVRQLAVGALSLDADPASLSVLIELATEDISEDVRAESAASLGPFATLAVYDELSVEDHDRIARCLFQIAEDEDEPWHVRRRAAESVAVFGDEPRVETLVQRMWDEEELGLRASALFAIGRGHLTTWLQQVLESFHDEDEAIRFEAVRAAGAIGDVEALPELSELALEDEDDDVRQATILAIGEIGGNGAIRILTRLSERVSGADRIAIDTALTEASLEADPLLAQVELEQTWQDDPETD